MGLDQIAFATSRGPSKEGPSATSTKGSEGKPGAEAWPASSIPPEDPRPDVFAEELLASWRKHNRLHGWMENLWESKGRPNWNGTADSLMGDFNCVPLELTWTDIEQLEAHVLNKTLPETEGFFFGEDSFEHFVTAKEDSGGNPPTEGGYYYKEDDVEFIANARKALQEGKRVFYDSWW